MVLLALISGDLSWGGEPERATTSFDARFSSAVLHQVARLFTAGFGRAEADQVSKGIDGLKADQTQEWKFQVQYQGKPDTLQIRAQMDDLGMVDLDFTTGHEAAAAVRSSVDAYLNGRGR
jgi:hypothetical protein